MCSLRILFPRLSIQTDVISRISSRLRFAPLICGVDFVWSENDEGGNGDHRSTTQWHRWTVEAGPKRRRLH